MKSDKLQDAIGMIKEEYIEEARMGDAVDVEAVSRDAATEPQEREQRSTWTGGFENYKGNSWTALAMKTERRDKIKQGKDKPYQWYRRIAVTAACIVLALAVIIPKLDGFNINMKNEMTESIESEVKEESGEAPTYSSDEAVEEAYESSAMESAGEAAEAAADTSSESKGESETNGDVHIIDEPTEPYDPQFQAEAFRLTAAEWNDNANWPFFVNLVNSGMIEFPAFGVDPRNRVKVILKDQNGGALYDEEVILYDQPGNQLWKGRSNKDGICYLFYPEGIAPYKVTSGGVEEMVEVAMTTGEDFQGSVMVSVLDDVNMVVPKIASQKNGTQVMFIVDTTGSMSDELSYLQMDFAAIAEETFDQNVEFSANFYRDQGDVYITRTNSFTKNLATVQNLLNAEYATGGGDRPEAVADILSETITHNQEWKEDYNKVAFLIFDAPPHEGTEQIVEEAVKSAAARGIHLVPVVASNAERDTELFGRAIAICTDGTYVFLTDDSGIGNSHLEPIVGDYQVELLHSVIVRIINSYK